MTKILQDNLKIARAAKGWTLADAENHTGIQSVTIGSYERGYRIPPIPALTRLAAHYEVTIGSLLGEQCPKCSTEQIIKNLEAELEKLKEAQNG